MAIAQGSERLRRPQACNSAKAIGQPPAGNQSLAPHTSPHGSGAAGWHFPKLLAQLDPQPRPRGPGRRGIGDDHHKAPRNPPTAQAPTHVHAEVRGRGAPDGANARCGQHGLHSVHAVGQITWRGTGEAINSGKLRQQTHTVPGTPPQRPLRGALTYHAVPLLHAHLPHGCCEQSHLLPQLLKGHLHDLLSAFPWEEEEEKPKPGSSHHAGTGPRRGHRGRNLA